MALNYNTDMMTDTKVLSSDILLELHVPSFEKAKTFYSTLGFHVVWERKPEGKRGYMVMKRKSSIINFYCGHKDVYKTTYFKRFSANTPMGFGVEIIIPLPDITKVYKKVLARYSEHIIKPLKERHGRLDFRMVDPFGFYLRLVETYDWVHGRDRAGNKLS